MAGQSATVTIDLEWTGGSPDDAVSMLSALEKAADTEFYNAAESTKEEFVDRAQDYAPVRTGTLQNSIDGDVSGTGSTIVMTVGSDVHYASFVELGTSKMAAQPFLRPALEDATLEMSNEFAAAISRAADRA